MTAGYNLIIAYPGNARLADFMEITKHIRAQAPEIHVYLVSRKCALPEHFIVSKRPTLIFCPQTLDRKRFPPGKVYTGRIISKIEQMRVLKQYGLSVPRWTLIEPGMHYSSTEWGRVVIVKPSGISGTYSRGISACTPEKVAYQRPWDYPEGHPGRDGPMFIQRFINTGLHPSQIRVLTLFGEPLYAEEIRAEEPQPMPELLTPESLAAWVVTPVRVKRSRSFVQDENVLRFARRIYGAFPDIPLQACDIIREAETGRLYVLEINPGGNTWHFSSHFGQHQLIEGRRREEQFDAFKLAARVLVERTRNEAE
jgi:hypothetical protein